MAAVSKASGNVLPHAFDLPGDISYKDPGPKSEDQTSEAKVKFHEKEEVK